MLTRLSDNNVFLRQSIRSILLRNLMKFIVNRQDLNQRIMNDEVQLSGNHSNIVEQGKRALVIIILHFVDSQLMRRINSHRTIGSMDNNNNIRRTAISEGVLMLHRSYIITRHKGNHKGDIHRHGMIEH